MSYVLQNKTICANLLLSIIDNYDVLLDTWEEALEVATDTETKASINGVCAQMNTFPFFYLVLS